MQILLNTAELAQMLRVSRQTIWRLRRDGRLRATHIGGRTLYHPEDVQQMIDAARNVEDKRGT